MFRTPGSLTTGSTAMAAYRREGASWAHRKLLSASPISPSASHSFASSIYWRLALPSFSTSVKPFLGRWRSEEPLLAVFSSLHLVLYRSRDIFLCPSAFPYAPLYAYLLYTSAPASSSHGQKRAAQQSRIPCLASHETHSLSTATYRIPHSSGRRICRFLGLTTIRGAVPAIADAAVSRSCARQCVGLCAVKIVFPEPCDRQSLPRRQKAAQCRCGLLWAMFKFLE